jgi:transposase, IS30 family
MTRPRVPLVVRRRFWGLVTAGVSPEAAGRVVGVTSSIARVWFVEAGGMTPMDLSEPAGRYLSWSEREEIAVGLAAGCSLRSIARGLGRDPATVSREVRRNRSSRPGQGYRARLAQHLAEQRARRPKPTRLAGHPPLRERVQSLLEARLSPEQIAGRLRREFPDDRAMHVSHETIYRALFVQGRGELRRELTACLRTGRAIRRPRRRVDGRRSERIPDMVMISDRPAEVADRAVPGHWEGDLLLGAANKSAIGTLVERRTRFVMLLHLPHGHGAEAVRDALIAQVRTLPAALRRSLTWDQGIEMRRHAEITLDADLPVYFCDPGHPWQRGTNENTNGLLRQYFPKGSDLSAHTAADLAAVADQLNQRPRKTLDYATPAEALNELLSDPTVATAP